MMLTVAMNEGEINLIISPTNSCWFEGFVVGSKGGIEISRKQEEAIISAEVKNLGDLHGLNVRK